MTFSQIEIDYMSTQALGRLATTRPDGTLQVSPVGFTYNAELGTIDIGGYNMTASWKYRNVADNGRVAFVVDDIASRNPWRVRCLEVRGAGEVTETADGSPIIRIHPRRIISFGLEDVDVDPHELVANSRNVS